MLNQQKEKVRLSLLQAEFNVIKQAEQAEKSRIEEFSRTADLEASVSLANEKLDLKERQLEERLMVEEELKQTCEQLMIELENKDREFIRLNNMLDEAEAYQHKFEVLSEEQLILIEKLQQVSL